MALSFILSFLNFNSIKVRLNLGLLICRGFLVLHFNSIKVRLNRIDDSFMAQIALFQFHKGTIKPTQASLNRSLVDYFNSIKVRLNQAVIMPPSTSSRAFQFHKGTIKPQITIFLFVFLLLNFNSIKVRLNRMFAKVGARLSAFQFHKGTIKPSQGAKVDVEWKLFQFHKGTIKPS